MRTRSSPVKATPESKTSSDEVCNKDSDEIDIHNSPKLPKNVTGLGLDSIGRELVDDLRSDVRGPGRLSSLPFQGAIPRLPQDYAGIVTTIFDIPDPQVLFDRVLAGIRPIKASQCSTGELLEKMDAAQENALLAKQLLVNMKVTVDQVDVDSGVLLAAMKDGALAALERDKAAGIRKKAITEGDVAGLASTMFPDEWKRLQDSMARSRQSIAYVEAIYERSIERARDLRAILGASRGQ